MALPLQLLNKTSDITFVTYSLTKEGHVYVEDATQPTEDKFLTIAEDYQGAMLFVVVTVCVYSLGIVAFIASHLYKRQETKLQDMQISEYLNSVESHLLARFERLDTIRQVQNKVPVEFRSLIEKAVIDGQFSTLQNGGAKSASS